MKSRSSEDPPELLYKFCSEDRGDFLSKFRLRYTPPADLNDAFEFWPSVDYESILPLIQRTTASDRTGDATLAFSNNKEINQAILKVQRILNQYHLRDESPSELLELALRQLRKETFGILCLAKEIKSQLMWAHYASNHQGFAIGLKTADVYFKNEDQIDMPPLKKVCYSDRRPMADVNAFNLIWDMVYTKHLDWSYENEWRMTKILNTADEIMSKGGEDLCLFDIPRDAVAEIVFGARCKKELIQKMRNDAKGMGISFRNAKRSPDKFEIGVF